MQAKRILSRKAPSQLIVDARIFKTYSMEWWLKHCLVGLLDDIVSQFRKENAQMEASGSSSYQTTIQETTLSDEDPDPHPSRGQLAIAAMNPPLLAFI